MNKDNKLEKRGGARAGAGRKTLCAEGKTVTVSVSIIPDLEVKIVEYAKELGKTRHYAIKKILADFFQKTDQ